MIPDKEMNEWVDLLSWALFTVGIVIALKVLIFPALWVVLRHIVG